MTERCRIARNAGTGQSASYLILTIGRERPDKLWATPIRTIRMARLSRRGRIGLALAALVVLALIAYFAGGNLHDFLGAIHGR